MSARFYPCLCGRIAAEWLIKMKLLSAQNTIYQFSSLEEFAKEFQICENDLILSNRCILPDAALFHGATCVWQEEYGTGEPTDAMVEGIRETLRKKSYQRIIAIGGGTVIDIGKLLVLPLDVPVVRFIEPNAPFQKERELLLVPTTCGTGSEMTNISIVTFSERNVKQGIVSDTLYADGAVLIPALIDALPDRPFAASLIDALIHSIESYLSPKATEYTRLFSSRAMELILQGMVDIWKNGLERRRMHAGDFLLASNLAGVAFGNAGCGPIHAMSYPLGATCHVPHGFANYTLFLAVLRCYEALQPEGKIAELGCYLGRLLECSRDTVYDVLEAILNALAPVARMSDYGATEADLPAFVENVQTKQGRLMANACVPLDAQTLYKIYQNVL